MVAQKSVTACSCDGSSFQVWGPVMLNALPERSAARNEVTWSSGCVCILHHHNTATNCFTAIVQDNLLAGNTQLTTGWLALNHKVYCLNATADSNWCIWISDNTLKELSSSWDGRPWPQQTSAEKRGAAAVPLLRELGPCLIQISSKGRVEDGAREGRKGLGGGRGGEVEGMGRW